MEMVDSKVVRISAENEKRVIKNGSGKFGDAFDDILTRVLNDYETLKKSKK